MGRIRMGRRCAPIQEFWYGSKALKIGRDSGLTGAERCSDRHRLEEVSHVDALVAHSLGAAFGIEKEVGTSRLGHRRRDPGLRTRASPAHERLGNLRAAERCRCSKSRAGPSLAMRVVLYHSSELY